MVEEISKIYPDIPVTKISSSIQTKWSGIRPLILEDGLDSDDPYIDTKKVARNHVIEISPNGIY